MSWESQKVDEQYEQITDLREQLAVSEACNTSLRVRVTELEAELAVINDHALHLAGEVGETDIAVAAERERCASLIDSLQQMPLDTGAEKWNGAWLKVAADIRKGGAV